MKPEFIEYLQSIPLSKVLIDRISSIYDDYQTIFPLDILDIFVCEYVKDDGSREYQSLWFFSENYIQEAKEFVIKNDIDISPYKPIDYVSFEYKDYNLKKAEDKSRLQIRFVFLGKSGELKASRENCDYLINVYRKFILPNFITYNKL